MDNFSRMPGKLPLFLVSGNVVFPGTTVKIPVKARTNYALVNDVLTNQFNHDDAVIGIVYKDHENATKNGPIGTAVSITQIFSSSSTFQPKATTVITVTGLCRIEVSQPTATDASSYSVAQVKQLDKFAGRSPSEVDSTLKADILSLFGKTGNRLTAMRINVRSVIRFAERLPFDYVLDMMASVLPLEYESQIKLLEEVNVEKRALMIKEHLMRMVQSSPNNSGELEVSTIPDTLKIGDLRQTLLDSLLSGGGNNRRPTIVRSSMENLNYGDENDSQNEILQLEKRLRDAKMPPETEKVVMSELKELQRMPNFHPNYSMLRNYLELIAELPWSIETSDMLDVSKAKTILNRDHHGLDDVKRRICEFLAVSQLRGSLKGPILCLVGPPGVGKTSIARSVAEAVGRNFQRISLGGVADQSELRGHRRTYIGSMPGRIIQGLKRAQSKNPVFLLDEVDKMTPGIHGDPAAALLEILDPEQNANYVDHYVNVPFDLSKVLFIATANSFRGIPRPLQDRMEIIEIPGYTVEEKLNIAKRHLWPKQLQAHSFQPNVIQLEDEALKILIQNYTKESGVRDLERKLAQLIRGVAMKLTEDKNLKNFVIDSKFLDEILGSEIFSSEIAVANLPPGVVAGLAWTPMGGEILWVEATKWPAHQGLAPQVTLTGQLGDVMKESATLALNWLRSNADKVHIDALDLESSNVHIHLPAGAVNKDGPSAGITVLIALVSLFAQQSARADTCMTGEISLRGKILLIGGVKEKILAAHRAGFKRILLPKGNEKDLKFVPADVKRELEMILIENVEQAIHNSFEFPLNSDQIPRVRSKL